jgi:hypothetical protein
MKVSCHLQVLAPLLRGKNYGIPQPVWTLCPSQHSASWPSSCFQQVRKTEESIFGIHGTTVDDDILPWRQWQNSPPKHTDWLVDPPSCWVLLLVVKRRGREINHLSPSSAEVNKECSSWCDCEWIQIIAKCENYWNAIFYLFGDFLSCCSYLKSEVQNRLLIIAVDMLWL